MSAGTVSAGPAGVRNLRAMFENKSNDQSTSPPSRGRSPNGSVSSQASRTLSKVRTSFVAVERPSESSQSPKWGLRKTSDVSSMAEVREEVIVADNNGANAASVEQDAPAPIAETTSLGAILKGSPFEQPPVAIEPPTEPIATHSKLPESSKESKPNGLSGTSKVASMIGKMKSVEQNAPKPESANDTKPPRPLPGTLNTKTTVSKSKDSPVSAKMSPVLQKKESPVTNKSTVSGVKPKGGVNKTIGVIQSSDKAKEERAKAEQAQGADSLKAQANTNGDSTTFKPQGEPSKITGVIQSSNQAKEDRAKADQSYGVDGVYESKPANNSNGPTFKPRGGVSKIQGVIQSSNKAKEERANVQEADAAAEAEPKKTTPKEIKPPSVALKATAASRAHAQKQDKSSPTEQVKSPTTTRPMKLPSAATAGTAASAARRGVTTGEEESKTTTSERKSILPQAPRVASVSTRASLAKKSSRVSLANGEERPRSRVSAAHKPADESFLARMTRPTASSARRAQENSQATSPPRVRQTSATHETTKKAGRKSLSNVSKVAPQASESEETSLAPVNEAQDNATLPGEEDEGEPGPAEEDGEDIVDPNPQQAEVSQETL